MDPQKESLRILLVNDYVSKVGGAEIYLYLLKDEFESRGHTVRIIAGHSENIQSWFSRWFSPRYFNKTRSVIKEFKPDVLHAQNIFRCISPSPILAANLANIPVILTMHDYGLYCSQGWAIQNNLTKCSGYSLRCIFNCKGKFRGLLNFPLAVIKHIRVGVHRQLITWLSPRIICVSTGLTFDLKKSMPALRSRISYMAPPVKFMAQTKNENKSSGAFLYVGRLEEGKGIELILLAINELLHHQGISIRLTIIGSGIYREHLERMSKSLNITSNILFLGHLNHQEINYHYTKSTCVISASVWQESLGLALIEAQSVGVPVIASDAGGVRDIIIDNYTGMLFPVGNWRRLSECMAKIALNPALGVRLGVAGRQHVLDHFSKAEGISRLLDLYQFESAGRSNT